MKSNRLSDYDRYTLLADGSELNFGYEAFLKFKEVKQFLNQISSTTADSFLHNGTIYKKRITSNEARKFLDGLVKNYCDVATLKKVANQLKIKI